MRQAFTWLGQIEPDKPSILAFINNYYLSPSTLVFFSFSFFAHLLFCTSHCFALFIPLHILFLFLFFTIYMLLCCVTFISFFILLYCPLSGPDLMYISLLIIPCRIYYVTNKETLNLIKMSLDILKWIDCDLWLITYKLHLLHGCWTTITLTSI